MLRRSIQETIDYLEKSNSDPDLIDMLDKYLWAQGTEQMVDCIANDSKYIELACTQDKLGWDNLLSGWMCTLFLDNHRQWLAGDALHYAILKWGRGLIEKLILITHRQWVFRNSHVHFKKLEGMTEVQHLKLFDDVEELMTVDPLEHLPKHWHLLEGEFGTLGENSSAARQNWIASMESAVSAAKHVYSGLPTKDRYKAFTRKVIRGGFGTK